MEPFKRKLFLKSWFLLFSKQYVQFSDFLEYTVRLCLNAAKQCALCTEVLSTTRVLVYFDRVFLTTFKLDTLLSFLNMWEFVPTMFWRKVMALNSTIIESYNINQLWRHFYWSSWYIYWSVVNRLLKSR